MLTVFMILRHGAAAPSAFLDSSNGEFQIQRTSLAISFPGMFHVLVVVEGNWGVGVLSIKTLYPGPAYPIRGEDPKSWTTAGAWVGLRRMTSSRERRQTGHLLGWAVCWAEGSLAVR